MIGKLLTIAFRNMRRKLRRTILTALAFAVAVFIYTVLVAVPLSMDRIAYNASKGRVWWSPSVITITCPRAIAVQSKSFWMYSDARRRFYGAIYRDPKSPIITYGVTPDITNVTASSDYQVPADLAKKLLTDRRYAMIGYALMDEYGWKLGQPVTLSILAISGSR